MLELKKVNKSFGDLRAVVDESWTLKTGEILGLIGQNGAGKSTTFKMILNLLKPDQGTITWNGKKIGDDTLNEIGFLPEERGLYTDMTIEDQVIYFAELHGKDKKFVQENLPVWMERFDVKGTLKTKIKKLSKGNQQKVQLITTLIHEPKLIILDEPFSGLDPVNSDLLQDAVVQLKKDGAAIIFSSHDMNNVEKLSDKLVMLANGRVVLKGKVNDVRQSFGRTRLYLESHLKKTELSKIKGVLDIKPEKAGYQLILEDPKIGEIIFKKATKNGYITAFDQQPPTLDEIFNIKVKENRS